MEGETEGKRDKNLNLKSRNERREREHKVKGKIQKLNQNVINVWRAAFQTPLVCLRLDANVQNCSANCQPGNYNMCQFPTQSLIT
jgi:hypothetical protein